VELVAPGVDTYSTGPGTKHNWRIGTSGASPHLAATAALVWAANHDLTNVQIRGILQQTAQDLGLPPQHQGHGLIRPALAIAAALDTSPPGSGCTFTLPLAISLGGLAPGTRATGSSTGSLVGDNSAGYTVTAIDVETQHVGYMVSADYMLSNTLDIGPAGDQLAPADESQTLLDMAAAGSHLVRLHVSREVASTDVLAEGYTITIAFTVTENE